MAAAAEGLFALELMVEEVLVTAPGPTMRPVVALRLLGFPTLLLHPAAATPPLRPGRAFPFGRGKRCLFRWRRNSLCTALYRRPLRALLLAYPIELAPGPPRLLGSCDVSLAPAAAELLQQPEAPASSGRRGRFPLRDAAGRSVGELVLGYRLTSLQGGEEPPPPSTASPRSATPPVSSPEPRAEEEDVELEGNIFCPPVLYYSREAAEPHLPPAAAAAGQWEHIKAWRPQDKDKGQTPPHPSAGRSLLHPTSPQQLHHTLRQLPLLNALLAELSVLTHRIMPVDAQPNREWAYQAPRGSGKASQPPSPGCSSALNPKQVPVRPPRSSEAANPRIKQEQQNDTSPGSLQPGKGPKKAVPQGETGTERNCKTKENRPPRKKLLYGLTKTLRLRLQQTNPGKLEIHERREQYRKKQMEVLKERSVLSKRKLLRNAGEQHVVSYRHCSKGNSSKKNNQFHKTVETLLQNDVLPEYISVRDVSPDLQKWATATLLKDNDLTSQGDPHKVTTAPLMEKTALKSAGKEKSAKMQLSEVFPSDADAQGSNEEAIYLIHHKTTECDDVSVASDCKPSSSRSTENGSEFIYSDDFVENTLYSEDFTSAEHTGRDSEALDSSPELESQKQGWSGTELKSNRSRILKMTQRSESASGPLPASSASFPGQSQKRNRDFKTSQRTSGESVDSLNLAQIESSSLDEEQEAQQISKDDNNGDHIKQVSTLRSKEVSSESDLNIGKGQTSAEKSQSVTRVPDPELSILENSMSDIEDNFPGKLCVANQYKDISDLVMNKLPGYTM
ncbi:microtubule-associated protein 10 [Melanerpes formicivorus]|uniref:microtubule-associated protein 10 n=1 Tax=Melanerpes formicivorus TaxID=211600 RepID=UPI00358E066E